jgi:cell division septation protein DedD
MHRLIISVSMLSFAAAGAVTAQVPLGADTVPEAAASQTSSSLPRPANDSLFRHARRLVSEGNGVAGRALVDSLLAAADPTTSAYGDALYWRGALAPTAADAEQDYRRVIVEYPLAYYAEDALLAIAELEQARGDRASALQHLERFVREHPSNPGRGIAALGAARLAFEERDNTTGCAMIAQARASTAQNDVELRNQIDYYGGRCTPAALAAAAPATTPVPAAPATHMPAAPVPAARPSVPPTVKPRAPVTPTPTPTRPAPAARAATSYTIQLAAYNTHAEAARLVTTLKARGVKARVSGTSKPFRVRLDFYPTRRDAANEVMALKRRGIIGFVTEEARPAEGRAKSP